VVVSVSLAPFALSLSKGCLCSYEKKGQGFDKLSLHGGFYG
jgi:hypothetical protein